MNRQYRKFWSLVLIASMLAPGCAPQQPSIAAKTAIFRTISTSPPRSSIPTSKSRRSCEVQNTLPPLTLKNTDNYEMWDLPLEEVVQITLCNSQVMRQLGGAGRFDARRKRFRGRSISPVAVTTTYDPALVETVTGLSVGSPFQGSGPEAALSEFDAQLDASVFWEKNRRPQNRAVAASAACSRRSSRRTWATFTTGITKTTADGTTFGFRNNTIYEGNNIPSQFPAVLIRARCLPATGRRTSKPRSAIRCCKAAARNTTASPAR